MERKSGIDCVIMKTEDNTAQPGDRKRGAGIGGQARLAGGCLCMRCSATAEQDPGRGAKFGFQERMERSRTADGSNNLAGGKKAENHPHGGLGHRSNCFVLRGCLHADIPVVVERRDHCRYPISCHLGRGAVDRAVSLLLGCVCLCNLFGGTVFSQALQSLSDLLCGLRSGPLYHHARYILCHAGRRRRVGFAGVGSAVYAHRYWVGLLSNGVCRFDDISFDEDEKNFSSIKATLEGSLTNKPSNAIIYATTNRMHLVKESFSSREGSEVHYNDTIDELVSLSDRFGIMLTFSSLTKNEYLDIVKQIASDCCVKIDENLLKEAEKFAALKAIRTPRVARQFINDYISSIEV